MKVIITSTPEFDFDTTKEVALLLNEVQGELEFLSEEPFDSDQCSTFNQKLKSIQEIDFLHFEEFFELCESFRKFRKQKIHKDDYVVLITSIKNHKDWFSAFSKKNIFIYGVEWEHYTKAEAKYGIAFQVIENIFQSEIGLDISDTDNEINIHKPSIGCINDFCADKVDIILKLRTADICESCFQRATDLKVSPLIIDQVIREMSHLRENFIFSRRIDSFVKPEKVHVDPLRTVRIGQKDVTLDALNAVVFIFFLKNLQGVRTKFIANYSDELKSIYKEVRDNPDERVIDRMVDKRNSNFRTVKTRLNQELNSQLGERLAQYYLLVNVVIGDGLKLYKINLDEEYISIEPPQRK